MKKIAIFVCLLMLVIGAVFAYEMSARKNSILESQLKTSNDATAVNNHIGDTSKIFPGACNLYGTSQKFELTAAELAILASFVDVSNMKEPNLEHKVSVSPSTNPEIITITPILMAYTPVMSLFCVPNDGKEGARVVTFNRQNNDIQTLKVDNQNFATKDYIVFLGWGAGVEPHEELYIYKIGATALEPIKNSTLGDAEETYYGFARIDAHIDVKKHSSSSIEVAVFKKSYDQSDQNTFLRSVELLF